MKTSWQGTSARCACATEVNCRASDRSSWEARTLFSGAHAASHSSQCHVCKFRTRARAEHLQLLKRARGCVDALTCPGFVWAAGAGRFHSMASCGKAYSDVPRIRVTRHRRRHAPDFRSIASSFPSSTGTPAWSTRVPVPGTVPGYVYIRTRYGYHGARISTFQISTPCHSSEPLEKMIARSLN